MKFLVVLFAAALTLTEGFQHPESVGISHVKMRSVQSRSSPTTKRREQNVSLEAAPLEEWDDFETTALSEPSRNLGLVLGAGVLSTVSFGWWSLFQETHHPGLVVSGICLGGCWCAFATRALAGER